MESASYSPGIKRISTSSLNHSSSISDLRSEIFEGKWKMKSDTCSLSSRNSDDDEEEYKYGSSYLASNPTLPLTPFKNQVGGHASFLRFSDKALCKPLDTREQAFYEQVSSQYPQLLPFVATYLGTVNVTFQSSIDHHSFAHNTPVVMLEHNKHLLDLDDNLDKNTRSYNRKLQQQIFKEALSPKRIRARFAQLKSVAEVINQIDQDAKFEKPTDSPKMHQKVIKEESDNEPMFQMSDDDFVSNTPVKNKHNSPRMSIGTLENGDFEKSSRLSGIGSDAGESSLKRVSNESFQSVTSSELTPDHMNPWSLHLYNTRLAKLQKEKNYQIQKFLLLEDLTNGLEYPCILDLKMGTRQYGVNASPEKKQSQERKCEKSTSKRLGVRICGMQLFKQDTQTYKYLDKYVGRQINISNFKKTLLSFLDNGNSYLIGHIPLIIEKLQLLSQTISTMPSARFYASSLLILYDGHLNPKKPVDIKMIDFANCIMTIDPNTNYPPTTTGPDSGYLLGLQTLISNFEEIYDELCEPQLLDDYGHVAILSLNKVRRASAEIGAL
ncbi:hypothetical protein HK103_005749 [Boothiomyces macroporosus]|uniref:Kinase n=1 Tax=Boothiomyces macroporosus TaxID=261099 RepID=A0AAD5Y767_9FUNG|nr:hypothetical protein HK103_005749 [Boothiomyces macroporosus]